MNKHHVSGQPLNRRSCAPTNKTLSDSTFPTHSHLLHARPEFFPIPRRGLDPFFGLSRADYYSFEKLGLLRLVRVLKPGNIRGKVLVPYVRVSALMKRFDSQTGESIHE